MTNETFQKRLAEAQKMGMLKADVKDFLRFIAEGKLPYETPQLEKVEGDEEEQTPAIKECKNFRVHQEKPISGRADIARAKARIARTFDNFKVSVSNLRQLAALSVFLNSKIMDVDELDDYVNHLAIFMSFFSGEDYYREHEHVCTSCILDFDADTKRTIIKVPTAVSEALDAAAQDVFPELSDDEDFTPTYDDLMKKDEDEE